MEDINFSVANEIIKELRDKDNEVFRDEFETFMQHMEDRKQGVIISH
jgi:hypothetical protein